MNNDMPSTNPRLKERVEDVVAALEKDRDEAIRLARMALSDGLVHPLFLNLRAFWLENRGRLTEALADLERAHEIAPNDVPVLNAMGLLFAKLLRHIDAAKAFERAVALDRDFAPAWFNLGWANETIGEIDCAHKAYEEAVVRGAGRPDSAEPLARLAALAARSGDREAARNFAARALAIDPSNPLALFAMARIEIDAGEFESAERYLPQILAGPSLSVNDAYHVMGAMGDLRHRQGRFAEAFQAYKTGNSGMRWAANQRRGYGKGETAVDMLRQTYRYYETWPPVRIAAPPPSPGTLCHGFLIGFIRSGTTLLEQILASHPDVVTMEEKEVFDEKACAFLTNSVALDRLYALTAEKRANYVENYWRSAKELGFTPKRKVFVDKQPLNAIKLPLIQVLFPDAKILFVIRDPRDVLLSSFRQRLLVTPTTYELLDLESAARYYDAYMNLAVRLREVLPFAWHEIRHEDIVADFEGAVGKVCDFLDIAWTGAMRDFAERRKVRAIASPSAAQIAKGLNREGVGQWRNYRHQMAPALPILAPWVKRFGYPTD